MSNHIPDDPYAAKADFSEIYDRPDPRSYYRTLAALGYEVPTHAVAVFERLLEALGGRDGKTVLDVCCSYGVNAALLNHDLTFADLARRYEGMDGELGSDQVVALDREWLARRRRPDAVATAGLDIAGEALGYARSVGLLGAAVHRDLETGPPGPGERQVLAAADLVTVTGGIGYVGERTFEAIVEASADAPPWIAAFNLRWFDFGSIGGALERHGLVVERLDGYCVPQRRFAHDAERQAVVRALRERGLDPEPELRAGAHCVELFVARPAVAARSAPLGEVLSGLGAG